MRLTTVRVLGAALFLLFAPVAARAAGWAVGDNGVVLKSVDAGANWTTTSPASVALNAVSFLNDIEGWAVGTGGLVLHTTNGGANWESDSPTNVNLNDVMFVDADHGWAVGNSGRVIRTVNGGASWTASSPTQQALNAVYFVSTSTGWAVGNGVVLRTVNGGINWTASAPTSVSLQDVFFINATTGWAVGASGTVLRSTNGGGSWSMSRPTSRGLNGVTFVDAVNGWAVGGSGAILQTENGGATWSEQRPVLTELNAVSFVDAVTGWAVGEGGAVAKTADGGDTWIATTPATAALNDVVFKSIPAGISIAVQTNPPGLSFTVDGVDYAGTQIFEWDPGDSHTIGTTSPQAGAPGTQYVWQNWSSGGPISQTVAPTTSRVYTATFTTQHYLTMTAGTNGVVNPLSGWHDAGADVSISATPDPGYGFNGWTGSGSGSYSGDANPASITMNGPVTETAAFGTTVTVTVRTSPSNRTFMVDGISYTSAQTFSWVPGASHTIEAVTPQNTSPGTRYVLTGWNDGGAASHSVAPTGNTTYSATFRVQHELTVTAGAGGTAGPAGGWTDSGSRITITAVPDSGYSFDSWSGSGSGSYTGAANPASIFMNGPITQQASFRVGTSPPPPASLTLLSSVPNPFAGETEVRFGLPTAGDVTVDVFDVAGRRVRSDVMRDVPAGWGSYQLDSVSGSGERLENGVYFVRVSAAGTAQTGKLVVLR